MAGARFDLRAQARRLTNRREIVIPNITTTRAQADSLALLYLKVVRRWIEASERIVASYERTIANFADQNIPENIPADGATVRSVRLSGLSRMVTDSPADTNGEIESADAAIRRLVLQLTPDLREWAFRVEAVHRGKWIRNVLSAVSIDLSTILNPADMADTVEAAIEWNVALVRDVSEELRRRISASVFSGFQARKPAREIAKEIREATGMARQRSLRIAADQTVKLGSRLNEARQQQAGLDHFKWRHSGKKHPRPHHEARDGKVYAWADPGIARDDLPGVPPYCGCSAQGVLVLEDD